MLLKWCNQGQNYYRIVVHENFWMEHVEKRNYLTNCIWYRSFMTCYASDTTNQKTSCYEGWLLRCLCLSLGQKVVVQHAAKTKANGRLACMLCTCTRGNNSSYQQVAVVCIWRPRTADIDWLPFSHHSRSPLRQLQLLHSKWPIQHAQAAEKPPTWAN